MQVGLNAANVETMNLNYQMVQNTTNSRWYAHFKNSKDSILTDKSIVLPSKQNH